MATPSTVTANAPTSSRITAIENINRRECFEAVDGARRIMPELWGDVPSYLKKRKT